jgi:polar amino acid transport system permease protein
MRSIGFNDLLLLLDGLMWTVGLSVIAFVCGGAGGLVVALLRTARAWPLRLLALLYIELTQGIPLLMLLFLTYFGLSLMDIDMPPLAAAALALTLSAAAFLGEIWRGAIQAVPQTQQEAAEALGLTTWQKLYHIILPQAFRTSIPSTVGFLVSLIKNTSLTSIIGFIELTRRGQFINNATFQPFLVFGIVALLYYAVCYPVARYSTYLEARLNGAR